MSPVRSLWLVALLGGALTTSLAVRAADPATDPVVAPSATTSARDGRSKTRDPNEVVCRNEGVLGSRLAKRKICMTRSEWAEANRADRTTLERAQVQRGVSAQ